MKTWKYLILGMLSALPAMAQLTDRVCPAPVAADFQTTELFNRTGSEGASRDATLMEPTRMDVDAIKVNGVFSHANVYFVERLGNVKFYDGSAKKVTIMGKIPTRGVSDNGLMGLALHPDFSQNRWIYFWYSPTALLGQNRQLRLTRITVNADNTLNMGSEKILINILASKTDSYHSGGPMQFDKHGDLWIAIGNNSSDLNPSACNVMSATDSTNSSEWGPSSTASMRGGFIRIRPDSTTTGYSIPPGNFGEYWANEFEKQGKTALAAEYRDPKKVLPEVYVKGERSNFSIAVHPTKRWLAWGTVNYSTTNDEFNITKTPIFSGFPYFHANNAKTCPDHTVSATTPMNNSPLNSGVKELPPARPGSINNLVNVAIGGPIYAFDSTLASPVKFPPHFNDKWLVAGFNGGMWAITFDTSTLVAGTRTKVDGSLLPRARNYIQSMYGKDGALYILNYDGYYNQAINPGVMRVAYRGACNPTTTVSTRKARPDSYQNIWLSAAGVVVGEKGPHTFGLYDVTGNRLFRVDGTGKTEYRLADLRRRLGLEAGLYMARVETPAGLFVRPVSLL